MNNSLARDELQWVQARRCNREDGASGAGAGAGDAAGAGAGVCPAALALLTALAAARGAGPPLVLLYEACSAPDPALYSEERFVQYALAAGASLPEFSFLDFEVLCSKETENERNTIPDAVLRAMGKGRALVGAVPPAWCSALTAISHNAPTPQLVALRGCSVDPCAPATVMARAVAHAASDLNWSDVWVAIPEGEESGASWALAQALGRTAVAPRLLYLQRSPLSDFSMATKSVSQQVVVLVEGGTSTKEVAYRLPYSPSVLLKVKPFAVSPQCTPEAGAAPGNSRSLLLGTSSVTASQLTEANVSYTFKCLLESLRSLSQTYEPWNSSTMQLFEQIDIEGTSCWRQVQGSRWVELRYKATSECACAAQSAMIGTGRMLLPAAITALLVALLAALVFGIRAAVANAGATKSPQSIIVAAADVSFPTTGDARRVDEGMEAMLSCWLQQLHEFGGPQPIAGASVGPASPAPCASPHTTDKRTRYKGEIVHIKFLNVDTSSLELRRMARDALQLVQALRHENVNPFIGCLCEMKPALLWEHCSRGSLEDVLRADDIKLDWTFRLSLLTDLVRGMRYVHGSALRIHGRLTSRNCVVDSRWVLRVTDYGLPLFYRAQGLAPPQRSARDLLWTAPELLRVNGGEGRGSQAGDAFSFGIVMQEVLVRGEPYCMLALDAEELVEKLRRPPPLIRPSVSMGAAPPEAVSVMRQCWSEQPELRPDFHHILDLFRQLHSGRKVNIVDSMFEMLEKYSDNLEQLVRERTAQLDAEKRKTEQLLNRMLPSSVAARLVRGARVEPEEFEDVSVYFSDIVGFTALAARCSPVQVVHLLHALYTAFDDAIQQYDVYKVETIGDAYMVVGGLPTRTVDHAQQVATMALHLLYVAAGMHAAVSEAGAGEPLRLRAGMHSGPVCAAVVGLTMPRYCLFGDTVNTASRMESTGAAGRMQVSAATRDRLAAAGGYRLRYRGLTPVKGKGAMHTYWLLGKAGFERVPPDPPPLAPDELLFEEELATPAATARVHSAPDAPNAYGISSSTEKLRAEPRPIAKSAPVTAPARAPPADIRCREYESARDGCEATRAMPSDVRLLRRQYSLEQSEDALVSCGVAPARPPVRKQHSAGTGAGAALDAPAMPSLAPAPASAARYRLRRARADTDFR